MITHVAIAADPTTITFRNSEHLQHVWSSTGPLSSLRLWALAIETCKEHLNLPQPQEQIDPKIQKIIDQDKILGNLLFTAIFGSSLPRTTLAPDSAPSSIFLPKGHIMDRIGLWPYRPELSDKEILLMPEGRKIPAYSQSEKAPSRIPKNAEEHQRNVSKVSSALETISSDMRGNFCMALDLPTNMLGCNVKINKGIFHYVDPFREVVYFSKAFLNNLSSENPAHIQLLGHQLHHALRTSMVIGLIKQAPRQDLEKWAVIVQRLDSINREFAGASLARLSDQYPEIPTLIDQLKNQDQNLRATKIKEREEDLRTAMLPQLDSKLFELRKGRDHNTNTERTLLIEKLDLLNERIFLCERLGEHQTAKSSHAEIIKTMTEIQKADPYGLAPISTQAKKTYASLWHGNYAAFEAGLRALLRDPFEHVATSDAGYPFRSRPDHRITAALTLGPLLPSLHQRCALLLGERSIHALNGKKEKYIQLIEFVDREFKLAAERLKKYESLFTSCNLCRVEIDRSTIKSSQGAQHFHVVSRDPWRSVINIRHVKESGEVSTGQVTLLAGSTLVESPLVGE